MIDHKIQKKNNLSIVRVGKSGVYCYSLIPSQTSIIICEFDKRFQTSHETLYFKVDIIITNVHDENGNGIPKDKWNKHSKSSVFNW